MWEDSKRHEYSVDYRLEQPPKGRYTYQER